MAVITIRNKPEEHATWKARNNMERREFLKRGGVLLAGTACACALPLLPAAAKSIKADSENAAGKKYGMVIDLNKCSKDCNACFDACRTENNVAMHGDKRWDIHLIRKVVLKRKHPAGSPEISVPLLCNHCDRPPCAQACPVKATYKRDDGIVIVDHHRCIGCRYCMISCPYNARFFNYKENHEWPNKNNTRSSHGVPESCTFCAHRLRKGQKPACVEACKNKKANALIFGDLNDPDSDISKLIAGNQVEGIREDFGTKPKVFYMGL
jgi:molybdopterin-containing oxidoreductase family iron-sulfur binding subunit